MVLCSLTRGCKASADLESASAARARHGSDAGDEGRDETRTN